MTDPKVLADWLDSNFGGLIVRVAAPQSGPGRETFQLREVEKFKAILEYLRSEGKPAEEVKGETNP